MHRPRRAFALIVTLLILSLLVIVAVSYLSSMVSERQTSDAYTSKTRAEQVAQAGVDSAMAILTESFRDFPDSATVWDTQQSANKDGSYSQGTSLYLRAMPAQVTVNGTALTVADPQSNASTAAANDSTGNNPNNPLCKNFVLPLISGVPGGRARLVSEALNAAELPTLITSTDLTKQNAVDLNVRHDSTDTKGVIGSSPIWTGAGPQPAQALWVNLKDSSSRITGRYAYWIEDESFRANSNFLSDATTRVDNGSRPTAGTPALPRSLQPSDLTLVGPLTLISDDNPSGDATTILNTRKFYPGSFFPDPLALNHSTTNGSSAFNTQKQNWLRYLTTTQSGALNLTRHGTQRLNLNDVVPYTDPNTVAATGTIQTQVNQIVQALKFHLPYFGERFYRLTTDLNPTTLNDNSQVPGSPKTSTATPGSTDSSEIYYYKVAANIRDYIDTDTQPTIIQAGGAVYPAGKPVTALNGSGSTSNEVWAVGKESAPYLQEAAIRLRPMVSPNADANGGHPFDLQVDYYLEFWNMSDRDIYASPQADPTLPNLHGATIRITNQNIWELAPSPYGPVQTSDGSYRLSDGGPELDYEIDLTNGVRQNGVNGSLVAGGLVFKAGAITVVTTDPDCATYVIQGPHGQTSPVTSAAPYATNPQTTYYCPNLTSGQRHYTGTIPKTAKGFEPKFRDQNFTYDYETEVTLCNSNGYLDSVPFAIDEHKFTSTWYSDTASNYHDYTYTSCLMGNAYDTNLFFYALPSELGDPRTNNEQLTIQPYVASGTGDQSHYIYGTNSDATLGYYNPSQKPDSTGASGTTAYPWPDYYSLPTPQYPATTAVNPMNAVRAPMVVADGPLSSIGQLGDVYDPARLPGGAGAVALSRGGGRTFKIGQRDDRYCGMPTSNNTSNKAVDSVANSNDWAAWRLTDVFSVDEPIELPARININGVRRDNGAALLATLQGFVFQPPTSSTDPVIHGDNHNGSSSLASATLETASSSSHGFTQLISQIKDRLNATGSNSSTNASTGLYVPSGPFFERGELGEIGDSGSAIFGMSDPLGKTQTNGSSTALVSGVDTYKTFDHSREELFRRTAELICTRGDTFTVYTVGQSIQQPTANGTMKVTGTHQMRVTFRLVPIGSNNQNFHPGYTPDSNTGQATPYLPVDLVSGKRFLKPDHYVAQVLSVSTY